MHPALRTNHLTLTPVTAPELDNVCALLWHPNVRRFLCDDQLIRRDDVATSLAESADPASMTAYWRMTAGVRSDGCVGLVGLRPPSRDSLRLRAIGWRSLELIIALDPAHWGRGYATEAVTAVAQEAGRDGVTFALVAAVDEPNERSHRLMRRSGFAELGRVAGPQHSLVIYERAV